MSLPEAIHIVMLTQISLRSRSNLGQLLDVLENVEKLAPTNWGPDERARNIYDREEMIAEVSSMDEFSVVGLRRAKPPRYSGYFWAGDAGLKMLKLEFGSGVRQSDLPLIFKLGDGLADVLEPEYGFVHLIWRKEDPEGTYSAASVITGDKFQACGPKPPVARTWFGPHLVKLIGHDLLESVGGPTETLPWGAIRLDLAAEPWEANFKTLSEKRLEITERLSKSGVFGDYTDWHDCKPGPQWTAPAGKGEVK